MECPPHSLGSGQSSAGPDRTTQSNTDRVVQSTDGPGSPGPARGDGLEPAPHLQLHALPCDRLRPLGESDRCQPAGGGDLRVHAGCADAVSTRLLRLCAAEYLLRQGFTELGLQPDGRVRLPPAISGRQSDRRSLRRTGGCRSFGDGRAHLEDVRREGSRARRDRASSTLSHLPLSHSGLAPAGLGGGGSL